MTDNPYSSPQSEPLPPSGYDAGEKTYGAIGGWLLLVGIGVAINPIRLAAAIYRENAPPFFNGAWQAVTTPGNPGYHSMWGMVLPFELLMNSLLAIWSVYLAFLFFGKRKELPRVIIWFFSVSLALMLIDFLLCMQIPLVRDELGSVLTRGLVRQVLACAIWIPYFRVSKRVKGTFVN